MIKFLLIMKRGRVEDIKASMTSNVIWEKRFKAIVEDYKIVSEFDTNLGLYWCRGCDECELFILDRMGDWEHDENGQEWCEHCFASRNEGS